MVNTNCREGGTARIKVTHEVCPCSDFSAYARHRSLVAARATANLNTDGSALRTRSHDLVRRLHTSIVLSNDAETTCCLQTSCRTRALWTKINQCAIPSRARKVRAFRASRAQIPSECPLSIPRHSDVYVSQIVRVWPGSADRFHFENRETGGENATRWDSYCEHSRCSFVTRNVCWDTLAN
jgi:hypothetical protein